MSDKPGSGWLRDPRVILLAIGAVVAGFLLAALLYGRPWHLPPAWGDIPTWLTAVVGAVAAWFVLRQLRQQQRVIDEDFARSRHRDELLDGQLREVADRERLRQREQAEHVEAAADAVIRAGASTVPGRGQAAPGHETGPRMHCHIRNGSRRPVRRVTVRLASGSEKLIPERFSLIHHVERASSPDLMFPGVHRTPAEDRAVEPSTGTYLSLLAGREIRAEFTLPEDAAHDRAAIRLLVRFTDDAGLRWELDDNMHLTRTPDEDW